MSVDASEMSREDKFFGVTAPLQVPGKEAQSAPEEEVELEIVDDLPKKPVKQEAKEEENDEELSDYSEKVRKRINKLKYEQHEAMRQREAAEKMREEAVRFNGHCSVTSSGFGTCGSDSLRPRHASPPVALMVYRRRVRYQLPTPRR